MFIFKFPEIEFSLSSNRKRKKRCVYTEDQLIRAVAAVKNKTLSLRLASKIYNVPSSTISDRVSGRIKGGFVKRGRLIYLYLFLYKLY